jgi:hypothetical protein
MEFEIEEDDHQVVLDEINKLSWVGSFSLLL